MKTFLLQASVAPFEYGQWDCGMFIANWIRFSRDIDPGAPIRGTYSNERGWMRLASREGGLDQLIKVCLLRIGMKETSDWHIGDVGVVKAIRPNRMPVPVGAIFGGQRWFMKVGKGITSGNPSVISAWSF